MSSTLPKYWPAMVLKFQSLIRELERQMPPGEFNSKRFENGWVQLNYQGTKILTVLSDPPMGVWPKTFERLEAFHGAVETLVVASYQEGRPESVAEILALCNDLAYKVLEGKLLFDYVPEPIFDRAKGKDPANDEVPIGEVTKPGDEARPQVRPKKSTSKGDAQDKLIAALSHHHKYEANETNLPCIHLDPVGNNELARLAGVDKATASTFFKKAFKGYSKYRQICRDGARLAYYLKSLRGEVYPADHMELVENAYKAGLEQGEGK